MIGVSVTSYVGMTWEIARGILTGDLQHIQAAINTLIAAQTANLQAQVNAISAAQQGTFANRPTNLTASAAGQLYYITDFGHLVRWTGSVWNFAPGDVGNRFLRSFFLAPQEVGWQLCDGSTVSYLVVGASDLTLQNITLPNLTGGNYIKLSNSVTGPNAAHAPGATMSGATATGTTGTSTTGTGTTGTGMTGTGSTGTGTSGAGSAHHHSISPSATTVASPGGVVLPLPVTDDESVHTHSIPSLSVPGLSVPGLSVPGLSIPGLSIPALGVGTLASTVDTTGEPANATFLPYFRR